MLIPSVDAELKPATANDLKPWQCNKKHGKQDPQEDCDHPWHDLQQLSRERNSRDAAELSLQLFLDGDPRIQGFHLFCLRQYVQILLQFIDYSSSDLSKLRAIESNSSIGMVYRIVAADAIACLNLLRVDVDNAAVYLFRSLTLCEEGKKQQQLSMINKSQRPTDRSKFNMNVTNEGKSYDFILIQHNSAGKKEYVCGRRTFDSLFEDMATTARGLLATLYGGQFYDFHENLIQFKVMASLIEPKLADVLKTTNNLRPSREQLEESDSIIAKCMLQIVVLWLECANCHVQRFVLYKNSSTPGHEIVKDQVTLRRCSKCKRVAYCSTDCQKQHWNQGGHKHVCRAPDDYRVGDIVLLRGLTKLESGGYKHLFGKVVKKFAPTPINLGDEMMFLVEYPDELNPVPLPVIGRNMSLRIPVEQLQ
ncbi:hypothetical protein HDU76_007840 [Blyttiomyces sp. JEL0837]|nr:hypothetical protein HDU76_007840 [Blyttiomyces sp. JEL0837]